MSAAPSAPPSPLAAFPCKMPAALRTTATQETLGWLTLPAGTTTDDQSTHIIQAAGSRWSTDRSPQLYGVQSAAWSTVINGWVPVPVQNLAPDGIHYAFLDDDGKIHIGNAQTGQELAVDNPDKLGPIAYTSTGVVLTNTSTPPNGLWLLDPATQSIAAISGPTGNYYWAEVSNGYAWGVDSPGVLGFPPSTKVITAQVIPNPQIINTPDAAKVAYAAPAGDTIASFATDTKGGVLVLLSGSAPGLVYLPAGGSATSYPSIPGVNLAVLGVNYADAHGIWFFGNSGVFLFDTTHGLQKIAAAQNSSFSPAGPCV